MPRPSNRETILKAAEEIVVTEGAAHLTLEAVAAKAGVSKGGLLYHFKSKEVMLVAMMDRLLEWYETQAAGARKDFAGQSNQYFLAHAKRLENQHEDIRRISAAMLAPLANDPKLLDYVRERVYPQIKDMFATVEDFDKAAIVYLAVEGSIILRVLGITPFDEEQEKRINAELLKMAESLK